MTTLVVVRKNKEVAIAADSERLARHKTAVENTVRFAESVLAQRS